MRLALHSVWHGTRWLAVVGAVVLAPSVTQGQIGSREEITARAKQHQARFNSLLRGEQPFDAKTDPAVVTSLAQWYVYRMTWNYEGSKEVSEKPHAMVKDFEARMLDAVGGAGGRKNQEFMAQWTKYLTACFKDVFALKVEDNRLECVNTALMLPALARSRQDVVGDYLADLLRDDKQHDVVKLFAVKGLKEFFPVRAYEAIDPADKALMEKKARDLKRVQTVVEFAARVPKLPKEAPNDLIDAAIYLRREAIKTLAHAQVPAVEVERDKKKKVTKVHGPIAFSLLKVLSAGDPFPLPPFTLAEKCEAVIGVCQLKPALGDAYRHEIGVYLVSNFLIEFLVEYQKDYNAFSVKDKELRKIPLVAWKVQADRLDNALKDLQANTPKANQATHKLIAGVIDRTRQPLRDVKDHKSIGATGPLRKFVDAFEPKENFVFSNLDEYKLQLRAAVE